MKELIHSWNHIEASGWKEVVPIILPQILRMPTLLLSGELGAGKTTLVKHIASALGYASGTTSPSFSIVNIYPILKEHSSGKDRLYHMDLYRLKAIEEIYDIGIPEYLDDPAGICLIEWPELVLPLMEEALLVNIKHVQALDVRNVEFWKLQFE